MENFDLIHAYIEGDLADADKRAFEARLEVDAEFRKAYESRRNAENTLHQAYEFQRAERTAAHSLDSVLDRQDRARRKKRITQGLGIVVVVALAAVLFLVLSLNNSPIDACQEFNSSPDIDLLHANKGAEAPLPPTFMQARQAYLDGDYPQVTAILDTFSSQGGNEFLISLMQGNARLGQCESGDAIPFLEAALQNPTTAVRARWFLALAYIGNNEQEKARGLLEEMTTQRYKKAEAEELLRRLYKGLA